MIGSLVVGAWTLIYEAAGGDHQVIYVIGTWLVSFVTFILLNSAFGCLDVFGLPRILQQFKIQKTKNVPMELEKYLQATLLSTFNMTVVVLLGLTLVWHGVAKTRMQLHPSMMPTAWRAAWDILLCIAINEIGFYYLHRLFHASPFLFKHIHKVHHSWTAPCSMAAFYAHPVEQLFVNMGGLLLGPALVGAHLSTAWFFWVISIASTIQGHSGYHLPLLPSSQAHDFHHRRGLDQYGSIGALDWFHSTNKKFKTNISYKRHFTIWWTPADVLVKSS